MMSVRHGSVLSLSRCAAAHSSNPAMRPASPPAVSTTARPSSRACSAMRGCGTNVGRARHAARVASSHERPQVVEPFARRDRHRIDATRAKRFVQPRRAAAGARTPIAGDVVDASRRARAARRRAARARRRRERSRRACRATSASSGSASRPSLSNVVAGMRTSAMPTAASASAVPGPGRERDQRRRPASRDRARRIRRRWRRRTSRSRSWRAPRARARAARDRPAAGSRSPER